MSVSGRISNSYKWSITNPTPSDLLLTLMEVRNTLVLLRFGILGRFLGSW